MFRSLSVSVVLLPSLCLAQPAAPRLVELRLTTEYTGVAFTAAFDALRRGLERDGAFRVILPATGSAGAIERPEFVVSVTGGRIPSGTGFFRFTALDTKSGRTLWPDAIHVRSDSIDAQLERVGSRVAMRITDGAWQTPSTRTASMRQGDALGVHLGGPARASVALALIFGPGAPLQGGFVSVEPGWQAGRASIGALYVARSRTRPDTPLPIGGSLRASLLRKYAGDEQDDYFGAEAQFIWYIGFRTGVFRPIRGGGRRPLITWDVALGF